MVDWLVAHAVYLLAHPVEVVPERLDDPVEVSVRVMAESFVRLRVRVMVRLRLVDDEIAPEGIEAPRSLSSLQAHKKASANLSESDG